MADKCIRCSKRNMIEQSIYCSKCIADLLRIEQIEEDEKIRKDETRRFK